MFKCKIHFIFLHPTTNFSSLLKIRDGSDDFLPLLTMLLHLLLPLELSSTRLPLGAEHHLPIAEA